jgi:predicted anti-sigma-YlaC factor YlaD
MDDCARVERLLARDADGAALDRDERARLDAHLASCADCRSAAVEQRSVLTLLRARMPAAASPRLAARVAAAVARG